MDDARLVDVETRLAYQEATLRELSDVLARQQSQIDRLEQVCRSLVERVQRGPEEIVKTSPEDEVPPHY